MLCRQTWRVFCSNLFPTSGSKGAEDCIGAEWIEVSLPRSSTELRTYYAFLSFFLPTAASPTRPVPNRSMVAGSGTGADVASIPATEESLLIQLLL